MLVLAGNWNFFHLDLTIYYQYSETFTDFTGGKDHCFEIASMFSKYSLVISIMKNDEIEGIIQKHWGLIEYISFNFNNLLIIILVITLLPYSFDQFLTDNTE